MSFIPIWMNEWIKHLMTKSHRLKELWDLSHVVLLLDICIRYFSNNNVLILSEQYFSLRFIYISNCRTPIYIGKFLLIFTYSRMFILILPYLFSASPNCWMRLHYLVGDIVGVVNLYLVIHDKIGVSILSPCNAFFYSIHKFNSVAGLGLCLDPAYQSRRERVGYLGGVLVETPQRSW
jgi:hypothetical protein